MPSFTDEALKLRERVAELKTGNRTKGCKSPTTSSKRKMVHLVADVQNVRIELGNRNASVVKLQTRVSKSENFGARPAERACCDIVLFVVIL